MPSLSSNHSQTSFLHKDFNDKINSMKKLIVVADDYGFTNGVNKGCIEASQKGILTEISLMIDSPATKEGINQILVNKIEGLGIHITLNDIVGTGKYLRTADYKILLEETSNKKLSNRVKDELKNFEDMVGRIPTHINGHQNCCLHPKIIDTVIEYALENDIYIRRTKHSRDRNTGVESTVSNKIMDDSGVKCTDYIFEHILGTYDEAYQGFLSDLRGVEDGTITEIFFHPAYVDDELRKYSSLLEDRERDLKLLTDKSFKEEIEKLGFIITNFKNS